MRTARPLAGTWDVSEHGWTFRCAPGASFVAPSNHQLWGALHARARRERTTVSGFLVDSAVLIEVTRGKDESIRSKWQDLASSGGALWTWHRKHYPMKERSFFD